MEASRKRISRDKLIEQYEPYVRYVVRRLVFSLGLSPEQIDEFTSAGYLGLVEAAEKFDYSGGASFRNYAYFRIRGAVIDTLRNHSQLSDRAYRYARALEAAQSIRENLSEEEWKKVANSQEKNSGQSLAKILDYATKGALVYRLSFTDVSNEVAEVPATESDPETILRHKQNMGFIKQIIASLPPQEREVVEDYYFRGENIVQIAAKRGGVSKSWISRLHSRAIERIKKRYFEDGF